VTLTVGDEFLGFCDKTCSVLDDYVVVITSNLTKMVKFIGKLWLKIMNEHIN